MSDTTPAQLPQNQASGASAMQTFLALADGSANAVNFNSMTSLMPSVQSDSHDRIPPDSAVFPSCTSSVEPIMTLRMPMMFSTETEEEAEDVDFNLGGSDGPQRESAQ